jgi:hypothetical protein
MTRGNGTKMPTRRRSDYKTHNDHSRYAYDCRGWSMHHRNSEIFE